MQCEGGEVNRCSDIVRDSFEQSKYKVREREGDIKRERERRRGCDDGSVHWVIKRGDNERERVSEDG